MSQFQYFYDGIDCSYYELGTTDVNVGYSANYDFEEALFTSTIYQCRLFNEYQWTVTSFETVLGLIGGFVGLIWSIITQCLGGYENFRFTQEIISEVYSMTTRSRMVIGSEPSNLDEAHADLKHCVETSTRYDYTYLEFMVSKLARFFCSCCCKRLWCYRARTKRL